mmetsp:Transcript_22541/g.57465  ORF Transcript_22541/g.57465 Transcript_22541/m.57465 type:complete len:263 (+) Transcript_22541:673-1461(+)
MLWSAAAEGEGTQAVLAPAMGSEILASSIAFMLSGLAHMPLPICPLPWNPEKRPTSTLESSYALIHGSFFMSALRTTGPAWKQVWISSPVRSRKPVLMKKTRALASLMHSRRLTLVRLSSSMIPILIVLRRRPKNSSAMPKRRLVSATSSGPCCFGFTMYKEPVRLFMWCPVPRRSCSEAATVMKQSTKPSGAGFPSFVTTMSVNMWWPTLRIKAMERPGMVAALPAASRNQMSPFILRVIGLPSFMKGASSVPRSTPVMLL